VAHNAGVDDATWGVPDDLFLALYAGAAIVLGVGGYLFRRRLVNGPAGLDGATLDGEELGYLVGGPRRAVAAALAGLRVSGSVGLTRTNRLKKTGTGPEYRGRLAHAVYGAAAKRTPISALPTYPAVDTAIDDIRADLVARGWLLSEEDRARAWLPAVVLLLLAGLGFLRVVVDLSNGNLVGWLVVMSAAVAVAGFVLWHVPAMSRSGQAALGRVKTDTTDLRPAAAPALETYGPETSSVAVGLYGTNVLMPTDSNLALQADIIYAAEEQARPESGGATPTGSGCASSSSSSSCASSSSSCSSSSSGSSCSSSSSS
jgi:uncharacterized protein (TIGR04222 family)